MKIESICLTMNSKSQNRSKTDYWKIKEFYEYLLTFDN